MGKVTLSKIVDIISGGTPKTSVPEYWDKGTIGWLSVTDFNNDIRYVYDTEKKITEAGLKNSNTRLLQKDDLIISARGTVGALAQIGTPMCFNQSCFGLRGKKGVVENSFLYYCLKNYVSNIKRRSQGSVFDTINLQSFDLMEIDIPNISTQQKIAAVLSALDEKIEFNHRINFELESMAKILYEYWFVQFDFPNEKGKPYKSAGGKMIWNAKLKREIPLGWEVTELRRYITSNRGVSYSGKDITGNGIPMINLNSFNTNSTYKPEGIKTFSGTYSAAKVLKPFDLVMCNTQQTALDPKKDIVGKSFLVPDIFESDIVSSHHVTTIAVEKELLKYYLNSLFNTEYFHRYISGYSTGTNILGLNFEGVLSYQTAIPSDDLLVTYKSIIVNIEKQKSRIIRESQTLTELRNWLLPMLMNGQVTVE